VNVIQYSLRKLPKTHALKNLSIYLKMKIRPLTMIFQKNGDVRNAIRDVCGKEQDHTVTLWLVTVIQNADTLKV
jgi:hypothetical protein